MGRKRLTILEILTLVNTSPEKLNKTELKKAKRFLISFGSQADTYLEAFDIDRRPGMIQKRLGNVCRLIRDLE